MERSSTLFTLLFAFVFVSTFFAVDAGSCRATECVGSGRSCNSVISSKTQTCQVGLYCTGSQCRFQSAENETCLSSGNYDQCANGRCIQDSDNIYRCHNYYTNRPGSKCTTDTQCYYTRDLGSLLNSTCLANGTCYGLPLGAVCDGSAAQCYEGTCSSRHGGTCVPFVGLDAPCDATEVNGLCGDLECMYTDINNRTLGVCKPQGSVAVGGLCGYRSQCQDGLFCEIDEDSTTYIGKCTQPPAPSNKVCTEDSQCTMPETCNCNEATGQGHCYATTNNPGYTASYEAFAECRKTAGCIVNTAECLVAACRTQYCASVLLSDTKENLLSVLEQPCINAFRQHTLSLCNITAEQIRASTTGAGTSTGGSTGATGATGGASSAGTTGTGTASGTTGGSSSSASTLFPLALLLTLLPSIFLF